jgi:hypothetical protein
MSGLRQWSFRALCPAAGSATPGSSAGPLRSFRLCTWTALRIAGLSGAALSNGKLSGPGLSWPTFSWPGLCATRLPRSSAERSAGEAGAAGCQKPAGFVDRVRRRRWRIGAGFGDHRCIRPQREPLSSACRFGSAGHCPTRSHESSTNRRDEFNADRFARSNGLNDSAGDASDLDSSHCL